MFSDPSNKKQYTDHHGSHQPHGLANPSSRAGKFGLASYKLHENNKFLFLKPIILYQNFLSNNGLGTKR